MVQFIALSSKDTMISAESQSKDLDSTLLKKASQNNPFMLKFLTKT
ncbi:hypothetical protein [Helicobacter rodentium]|nr:hypothetical protein [Helicobacter rodentium]